MKKNVILAHVQFVNKPQKKIFKLKMLVRNFDDYSYGRPEFLGLKKEGKFWFPFECRYVAWCIVVASIIISSWVLMMYGRSFGMVKTYLWATAFVFSFFLSVLIIEPVRILVFSGINSIFTKKTPIILRKRMPISLLSNPLNKTKKNQVLKYRKSYPNLYFPTPISKLQSRFEDVKYNIELRNLTIDMISYIIFMGAVCYFVLMNKTQSDYYSNTMVSELVLSGSYTSSIPFNEVHSYESFLKYLNETLIPALLFESSRNVGNENSTEINKKNTKSHSESNRKRKRQNSNTEKKSDVRKRLFEKGWTMNHYLKLLGKPRLRQIRVKGSCKHVKEIKTRVTECAPKQNLFNVETRNFSLKWDDRPQVGLTEMQARPFSYQSAWDTGSLFFMGTLSTYPGGGYVLDLAKHIADARLIIDFMDVFQWVDVRTRAIFIEFTLYNANLNLFNVVTLALEKSITGYMIPSHQIHTCKFIFVQQEVQHISFVMIGLLAFFLIFSFLRESVRMHRTTIKTYFNWGFALLDLTIIFIGALSFLFLILRGYYVSLLLKKLQNSYNNEFVSFFHAACWYSLSVYTEAILVLLAAFKFLRLLTFRVIFYQIQVTFNHCYKHFFYLGCQQITFLLAFGFFFYLSFVNYSENFSTLGQSLSTLFGRGVAYDDTFELELLDKGVAIVTPFFFWLFIVFIALLFVNVFIAIICLYFHVIRLVPLYNKYNIFDYIKYIATKKEQTDILHLKYKKVSFKNNMDQNMMKVRGGGKAHSKKKDAIKEKSKKDERKERETHVRKVMIKNFITENLYDPVEYIDIKGYRLLMMRDLVASYLAYSEEERVVFRENAIKILFCDLIYLKTGIKREELSDNKGFYFLVSKNFEAEVLDKRVFNNMKRVVEKFGNEKGWFIEDVRDKEISHIENKLLILKKKLGFLHNKLREMKI